MSPKNQRGYALLATATMILLGIAITALVVGKSMYFEQKIQSNEYQQYMAFQAAEAGLEYGIGYLYNNQNAILVDTNHNGFIDPYTSAAVTNVVMGNGSNYSVTYNNIVANNYDTLQVSATGHASNGESQRTITVLLKIYPMLVSTPPAGLIAKNNVDLGGNVTITNTSTGTTIWSGGSTGLTGSASTSSNNAGGSDSSHLGPDVVQNDANLAALTGDQFFAGFFGASKAAAQQNANVVYTNSSDTNMSSTLDGVVGKSLWINQTGGEARINSNTTIGSAAQPVILIVNGPLRMNGNLDIYGLVYVIGDWTNSGGGTLTVHGSAVVEGNLSSTGTPNVIFDQSVLGNLGQIGQYTKVPGSWRDF